MAAAGAGRVPPAKAGKRSRQQEQKRVAGAAAQFPLEHRLLLTATFCLLAVGAVMVYSASSATTLLEGQGDAGGDLIKFVAYGAVGLVLMRALARDGVAKVQTLTGPLLAISFALVLAVHVPGVGVSVNGARRWLGRGALLFEPSELMKLALVLYAAGLLARRPRQVHDLRALANPLLLVVGAACMLVLTQPDLGTAMVIAFTVAALLVAAGIPLNKLSIIACASVLLLAIIALAEPYARARLTSFIDPWAHASGSGFQAVQGQIAIGSGGLLGTGPGQSVQKIFYLPEASTDFILAVTGEEFGAVGVCVLMLIYGVIGFAGLRAAKKATSVYSALIAVGVTALILSQALLNTFAVLGLAPLTGVPLPFVSYGSSSLIVMLAAMGLLLNVASGTNAHVRGVANRRPRSADARGREPARWENDARAQQDRDRRGRDRRARGSGSGGG